MISYEEATSVGYGVRLFHVLHKDSYGNAISYRVNGKCKVWKTRPTHFRLPVKRGLYDAYYITQDNAHEWTLDEPASTKEEINLRIMAGLSKNAPMCMVHDKLLDMGLTEEARRVMTRL